MTTIIKAPVSRVFYSTTETAAILGCSKKTVYCLLRSGKLPHIRLGRVIRINANDIKALSYQYARPEDLPGDE